MLYTEMTIKAMRLCYEAHKGQFDKGGVPYVFHPYHIAEQMEDEEAVCVALLHDVVEDTAYTIEDISAQGFSETIVEAVKCLTKEKGSDYMHYIDNVKKNELAKRVKLEDIKHNSDEQRLRYIDREKADRLTRKYIEAKKRLME